MSEQEIMLKTLRAIEEIAANRSEMSETEDEQVWAHVYKLCHNATSPDCRKNHPAWSAILTPAQVKP